MAAVWSGVRNTIPRLLEWSRISYCYANRCHVDLYSLESHRINSLKVKSDFLQARFFSEKRPTKVVRDKQTISLVDENNCVIGLKELHEVEKFAKKRNLKLIRISDENGEDARFPVYQIKEKKILGSSGGKVHEKVLLLAAKINDHDLNIKLVMLNKWLNKGSSVKIQISSGREKESKINEVLSKIEESINESGKIQQKTKKGSSFKLFLKPIISNNDISKINDGKS